MPGRRHKYAEYENLLETLSLDSRAGRRAGKASEQANRQTGRQAGRQAGRQLHLRVTKKRLAVSVL